MTQAPPGQAAYRGAIGVARRDITPPLAVRARCWAAAEHEHPDGVHRPLTLTALVLSAGPEDRLVLITADLTWWRSGAVEQGVRQRILDALGLEPARLVVHLVHTHAGPTLGYEGADAAERDALAAYLETVADMAVAAARTATEDLADARLEWGVGWSGVAAERDLAHEGRMLVGWNPDAAEVDRTLLLGRATALADGRPLATLVNYACHPTTLGAGNRLLSPDYVGAAREVVEVATGAPCLFLQGASGELAPREQYVADTAVADRHGRSVGHAALATLDAMPAPGTALAFDGVVESGAPLAIWTPVVDAAADTTLDAELITVSVARQAAPLAELDAQWSELDERTRAERLDRARGLRADAGDGDLEYPVWIWRIGGGALVAQPGEAYSWLQRELRRRHGPHVAVLNCANGPGFVYLPTRASYERRTYSAWQTLAAAGSLERVADAASERLAELGPRRLEAST